MPLSSRNFHPAPQGESLSVFDQKFTGVVSTETEIWFFEKKISSKKIAKKKWKKMKIWLLKNNILFILLFIF
jgi:hypothetical protein